eukprot:CAMPEP_0194596250 /NCGR_PEP_ID=MMETSP0292-20121207/25548_1 /TAXON_ID=39354 /ORGANISM="Heterosigma akashiwo, Strain CCMP2393" /LENGTH=436 /DNA_ID=CAMNT_0039456477 /DNA_START=269 /DNA_END=1582 /DNA_ORIENTATION=+
MHAKEGYDCEPLFSFDSATAPQSAPGVSLPPLSPLPCRGKGRGRGRWAGSGVILLLVLPEAAAARPVHLVHLRAAAVVHLLLLAPEPLVPPPLHGAAQAAQRAVLPPAAARVQVDQRLPLPALRAAGRAGGGAAAAPAALGRVPNELLHGGAVLVRGAAAPPGAGAGAGLRVRTARPGPPAAAAARAGAAAHLPVARLAEEVVLAGLAVVLAPLEDLIRAVRAGFQKSRRVRVVQVEEHHGRAVLGPAQAVELVVVPLAEVEEGLPRVQRLALRGLVRVRRRVRAAAGGWASSRRATASGSSLATMKLSFMGFTHLAARAGRDPPAPPRARSRAQLLDDVLGLPGPVVALQVRQVGHGGPRGLEVLVVHVDHLVHDAFGTGQLQHVPVPLAQPVVLGRLLALRVAVDDVVVTLQGWAGPDMCCVETTSFNVVKVSY